MNLHFWVIITIYRQKSSFFRKNLNYDNIFNNYVKFVM